MRCLYKLNMSISQENDQFKGPFSCHMDLWNLQGNPKQEAAALDSIMQPRPHIV